MYKILPFIIQWTIGLVLPWWLLQILQRAVVSEENKFDYTVQKFEGCGNFIIYTIGLIVPWWLIYYIFNDDK